MWGYWEKSQQGHDKKHRSWQEGDISEPTLNRGVHAATGSPLFGKVRTFQRNLHVERESSIPGFVITAVISFLSLGHFD
jgi:hypothetical protein